MANTSFYTTFSTNHFLLSRAENGSESGLQSAVSYRFGFNGKENDNEVKGTGNQQDYGMRIYDPRLGRFLSVDPLTSKFPFYTPYQFAGNNPIYFIDKNGEFPWPAVWLVVKLFAAGAAISVATQFTVNCIYYQDARIAFDNVDFVDATTDGAINVVTGGGSAFRTIFKDVSTFAIKKGTKILFFEIISASVDFTAENKFVSVFNGDKSTLQFAADLVLGWSCTMASDQIVEVFRMWAKTDLKPSVFAPLPKDQKELVRKLDKIVKSDAFSNSVDGGVSVMEQFVNDVLNSKVTYELKKTGETSVDPNTNSTFAPADATKTKEFLPPTDIQISQ